LKRKLLTYSLLVVLLAAVFALWANYRIVSFSKAYLYNDTAQIKSCKTALLLGTARHLAHGTKNPYFFYRIEAAVNLFQSGKIKYFIISGDNSVSYYNEPQDMKRELVARGVPDSCIYLDYAGFRTLDSVVRAKEIFGQDSVVVVSQQFHNERAVYLARHYGLVAFGYNAQDVNAKMGFKTNVREFFARTKVMLDLWLHIEPKFYGEKIKVGA